jgi:hypothetical protein
MNIRFLMDSSRYISTDNSQHWVMGDTKLTFETALLFTKVKHERPGIQRAIKSTVTSKNRNKSRMNGNKAQVPK